MDQRKDADEQAVRRCLIAARYQKLDDGTWCRVGRLPQIESYLGDVSEKFREPRVQCVTPTRVVIRVFDERAVDLSRLFDPLADYSAALARCDDCLRREVLGEDQADLDLVLPLWY